MTFDKNISVTRITKSMIHQYLLDEADRLKKDGKSFL